MLNKSLKSVPCERCKKPTPIRVGRPIKFCSKECELETRKERFKGNKLRSGLKPANSFKSGHTPWNKNKKGIHLSPNTEFKPGARFDKRDAIGTVRIRTHKGTKRAWIKVSDPNVWRLRAVVVWEIVNGPLPKGFLVHHEDRSTLNDSIENLKSMTRAEHLNEHRNEFKKRTARIQRTV